MAALWCSVPGLVAGLGGLYAIATTEDMMEQQLDRWCLHDAVAERLLPPVAGLLVAVQGGSVAMVDDLKRAGEIPGCEVRDSAGVVALVASGLPLQMPVDRWNSLLMWVSGLDHRCERGSSS